MAVKITSKINAGAAANRVLSNKVKLAVANNAYKLMNDYVPMDSGALSKQVSITPEYIHYKSPYAHFDYVGMLMVSPSGSAWAKHNEAKHYAVPGKDLNFSKEKHPLATANWDKAMITGRGRQFFDEAEEIVKRGG